MKKVKGILFSGSEENVELTKTHIREHGIVYWSLPVTLKYEEYRFPIIALLHVKGKGVRYRCIISDVIPFRAFHFKDPKKKAAAWIKEQKIEKRNYMVTLVISKMTSFDYETQKLRNWEGRLIGNAPQGYTKIIIPFKQEISVRS